MTTAVANTAASAAAANATQSTEVSDELAGKYLTFKLANEVYGVEILKVREIIGPLEITAVPRMPSYMKGVINLRGKVIPVVDLRSKFGLEEIEFTEQTCIIVIDVGMLVGIIVDTVQEVADISGDQIDPAPPLGSEVNSEFILGMAKSRDSEAVKILLQIEKVLDAEQWQELVDGQEVDQDDSAVSTS